MLKKTLFAVTALFASYSLPLSAHCQMPCGIYHDQMVYDQVDEFYETMYKCCKAMGNNKFETGEERNCYIRWVMTKDRMCDETAHILTTFFLQQKIKPGEDETADLVICLHKCLFLIVAIKQNVDVKIVEQFGKEWENFKKLFHPEVECKHALKIKEDPTRSEGKDEDHHDHESEHEHSHDGLAPHTH